VQRNTSTWTTFWRGMQAGCFIQFIVDVWRQWTFDACRTCHAQVLGMTRARGTRKAQPCTHSLHAHAHHAHAGTAADQRRPRCHQTALRARLGHCGRMVGLTRPLFWMVLANHGCTRRVNRHDKRVACWPPGRGRTCFNASLLHCWRAERSQSPDFYSHPFYEHCTPAAENRLPLPS